MKCQRCGCNIDKVVPFEDNHGIKDNTIHTIKTEKIVNGVIVDFRIFFVCEKCWRGAINEVELEEMRLDELGEKMDELNTRIRMLEEVVTIDPAAREDD